MSIRFKKNGGKITDVPTDIKTKNEPLRKLSYGKRYLSVGNTGGCTATWIGNDKEYKWSYILTAAHCVKYYNTVTDTESTFFSWDNKVIADGKGLSFVPKERVDRPTGMGGASTDIAILKLPFISEITDSDGNIIEKPILNDSEDEMDKTVTFVGYGSWGIGFNQSGSYWPEYGDRRLLGQSKIDSIFELDHGISASYKAKGPSDQWARVAPGDSGSAWWQEHNSINTIIATTNGGTDNYSTGARVSKYKDWIKSIYPEASFLSEIERNIGVTDINFENKYPSGGVPTINPFTIAYYIEPRLALTPDKPSVCRIESVKDTEIQILGLLTGGVKWYPLPVKIEHMENGDRLKATLPVPYGYTTYQLRGNVKIKCLGTSTNESVRIYTYSTNALWAETWSEPYKLSPTPKGQ